MSRKKPCIWVVDDDLDVLGAVTMLLRSAKLEPVGCRSGAELLERIDGDAPGCILLDLRMPRMGGLEVQRELTKRGCRQPVVFLSGHGDIPVAVKAVRDGALDFLEKPVRDQKLLEAVRRALEVDRKRRADEKKTSSMVELLESLSPREAEVAGLLARGMRTPEIADELGLSTRTVEMHRARLLRRVGARTSAEAASILQNAQALRKRS